AGVQPDLVPRGGERHAVVIDEGQVVAVVELDHPLVLTARVGAHLAAVAVVDVVVDDAAVDQRALLLLLVGCRVPLALRDVLRPRQQLHRWQRAEEAGGEGHRRGLAGLAGPGPRGRAGIAPPREIGTVLGLGRPHRLARAARGSDAVADQPAVALE